MLMRNRHPRPASSDPYVDPDGAPGYGSPSFAPNEYAFIFTVKDGKITEVAEDLDTALVETAAYGRKIIEGDS